MRVAVSSLSEIGERVGRTNAVRRGQERRRLPVGVRGEQTVH